MGYHLTHLLFLFAFHIANGCATFFNGFYFARKRQMELKSLSHKLSQDLKLEPTKIPADLLKPVHTDSKISFELIKKPKRKRSQHFIKK